MKIFPSQNVVVGLDLLADLLFKSREATVYCWAGTTPKLFCDLLDRLSVICRFPEFTLMETMHDK